MRLILCVFAILVWVAPASASTRIALVIGNSAYLHGGGVSAAEADARDVAKAFEELGFDTVVEVPDARFNPLNNAFKRFQKRAARADLAVIYYVGHGVEVDGANHLLAVNAKLKRPERFEKETAPLAAAFAAARAAGDVGVVLIDAYRSNEFADAMAETTDDVDGGVRAVDPGDGVVAIYAAPGGSPSTSVPGPYSALATAFLEQLQSTDLGVRDVVKATAERVASLTDGGLTPIVFGLDRAGDAAFNASVTAPSSFVDLKDDAIVVDAAGGADFTSIQAAINTAPPNAVVKIRPGVYREALKVIWPIELVGDGDRGSIVIEAEGADVLHWAASSGRVSGLTIRQVGPAKSEMGWGAVYIEGSGVIEGCDITSSDGAVVQVLGRKAEPTLRGNRIAGGAEAGVALRDSARGVYEGNEILDNGFAGFEVLERGDPVVRDNIIKGNKLSGVYAALGAGGAFEGNQVLENGQDGLAVEKNAAVTARDNVISSNALSGVWVGPDGGGSFIENDLRGNGSGAFKIESGAGSVERDGNTE